jgi:hypothetical protein
MMMNTCPECGQLFDTGYYFDNCELCSPDCRSIYAHAKAEREYDFRREELQLQRVEDTSE